jgi:hypothetical protein
MKRDGFRRRVVGVSGGGHERAFDGVGFRRACQINGRLRKRIKSFGQTYQACDVRRRRRLHHRLRVCQPYIFGSENAEAARYEHGISPAFYEPREPVQTGVNVRITQRLDKRGSQIVVLFAAFIVSVAGASESFYDGFEHHAPHACLIGRGCFNGCFEGG